MDGPGRAPPGGPSASQGVLLVALGSTDDQIFGVPEHAQTCAFYTQCDLRLAVDPFEFEVTAAVDRAVDDPPSVDGGPLVLRDLHRVWHVRYSSNSHPCRHPERRPPPRLVPHAQVCIEPVIEGEQCCPRLAP